ncbi:hypothetical protein SAMN05216516_11073 [Izhakiella capsodis]|uniref:Uncharacterized protein n=1 Tax=Izhakiella capsodis TaxID=1367852 RepID=A0A1I4ZZG4_9GAMM|nr:hypothetical protein SAMN05216516_11073 [Izhakiella capsodis]
MEQACLSIYKTEPKKAAQLIQTFEDKTMTDALTLTYQLTMQVITKMIHNIDMKYHFEGAWWAFQGKKRAAQGCPFFYAAAISDINIRRFQCILFDKGTARFDRIAHQRRE